MLKPIFLAGITPEMEATEKAENPGGSDTVFPVADLQHTIGVDVNKRKNNTSLFEKGGNGNLSTFATCHLVGEFAAR